MEFAVLTNSREHSVCFGWPFKTHRSTHFPLVVGQSLILIHFSKDRKLTAYILALSVPVLKAKMAPCRRPVTVM